MKILVVEVVGLPPAFLGCYGNAWVATPTLDRLAWEGVVFDRHFVERPTRDPDEPTGLVCGRYPCGTLDPARPTLPELLAARTSLRQVRVPRIEDLADTVAEALTAAEVVWVEGPDLFPPWNLPEEVLGSYFEDDEELAPWPAPPVGAMAPDEEDLDRLQRTFAAAITFFDAQLEAVVEAWEDGGDGLLIVTGRCGLPLGEHGVVGELRPPLHEELVHVPLVVRFPDRRSAGLRVLGATQPVDLAAWILEVLGVEVPHHFQGRSPTPLLEETRESIRPAAVSVCGAGEEEVWALRTEEWALVPRSAGTDTMPGLFRQPEDRWEVNDLAVQNLDLTDALAATLSQLPAVLGKEGPPDDADLLPALP